VGRRGQACHFCLQGVSEKRASDLEELFAHPHYVNSFLFYPVYWLAYNQMTGNLTSQAAVMELNGVPNDIINNINPISLIVSEHCSPMRWSTSTTKLASLF
jgi:dipeptide/tripeptide permease